LLRLGLPVPPAFVIDTAACAGYLRDGRFPDGLDDAVRALAADTVSVRSGAPVSMPGMLSTVLGVAPTPGEIRAAIAAVVESWRAPRAVTYRRLHDIPDDLGTAVIVQAMVFGDRDGRSGAGVAFSRDPSTGAKAPFGEVVFGGHGDEVVAGRSRTRPLADLADRWPSVYAELTTALGRLERHHRDVCHVEFTVESGRLWFLQVRTGGLAGRAAVRAAVDLVDEKIIDRRTAVRRITPHQLASARVPRINAAGDVLVRGTGASPGVATGRVAVTADRAARMAGDGSVVLVRAYTSPLDLHGLAAAAGVVTARGGPTSHAALVARSMGKPAVVAAGALTVDENAGCVRAGDRSVPEGTVITIDGTGGEVVIGDPGTTAGRPDEHLNRLLRWISS
jgi:pyruvate,orthophosphate dikinase